MRKAKGKRRELGGANRIRIYTPPWRATDAIKNAGSRDSNPAAWSTLSRFPNAQSVPLFKHHSTREACGHHETVAAVGGGSISHLCDFRRENVMSRRAHFKATAGASAMRGKRKRVRIMRDTIKLKLIQYLF
jgi:hypothetical protein